MFPKFIVVLSGPPLSGKTTLGILLSKRTNLHLLDIDHIRQMLFNNSTLDHFERKLPLTNETSEKLIMSMCYEKVHELASHLIKDNTPVILTATYSGTVARQRITNLAIKTKTPLLFINLSIPEDQLEERIGKRKSFSSLSNVLDIDHFQEVNKRFNSFGHDCFGFPVINIDTNLSKEECLSQIITVLNQQVKKPHNSQTIFQRIGALLKPS